MNNGELKKWSREGPFINNCRFGGPTRFVLKLLDIFQKMGGILKNPLPEEQSFENEESVSEFRKQVYKNTQLNAKLTSKKNEEPITASAGVSNTPKDTVSLKHQQDEALKWNQTNLEANEATKQQFQDINIDEPKTPYQGAVDPSGEYYKPDDEDDLNNFSLGEPEVDLEEQEGSQHPQHEQQSPSESSSEPLTEEEAKHKRFEEMRRKHYDLKGVLKDRRLRGDEDEEDEEDKDEE